MLAFVGTICLDYALQVPRLPERGEILRGRDLHVVPGGHAGNSAAWSAALGHATTLVCGLGDDVAAAACRAHIAKLDELVLVEQRIPSTIQSFISIDGDGERTITYTRPDERDLTIATDQVVHLVASSAGSYIDIPSSHRKDRNVLLSAAYRAAVPFDDLAQIAEDRQRVAWTFGSLDDGPRPDEQLMHAVGLEAAFMTDGPRGCDVWTPNDGWVHVDAAPAPAVADTTGAGDSFLAGTLVKLAQDVVPIEAARAGAFVAARCVAQRGGWPQR